jgi:hypothetical protein
LESSHTWPTQTGDVCFSDTGLKDNRQLYAFLEEHHFEIEPKAFPKRPPNETNESEELIVLVLIGVVDGALDSRRLLPKR